MNFPVHLQELSRRFFEGTQILNFMKIYYVGAESFHAGDGQT